MADILPPFPFPFPVILFDVGDTLLAKVPANWQLLRTRCQSAGLSVPEEAARCAWQQCEICTGEQLLQEFSGAPRMPDEEFTLMLDRSALRSLFLGKSNEDVEALALRLRAFPPEKQRWQVKEGVLETLEALQERRFTLGVVSNFSPDLPDLLRQQGLGAYFQTVVVSSLVGLQKPDPEILRLACGNLGVKTRECLYVGDHPFDVLCTGEAGMASAWIKGDWEGLPASIPYRPDYTLSSITGLLDLAPAILSKGEAS